MSPLRLPSMEMRTGTRWVVLVKSPMEKGGARMPAPISSTLPAKLRPGIRVHVDLDRRADLDPADLGLLEIGGHPDPVQVVDRVDGLARLDDVARHHGLLVDHAGDGRGDPRVEHLALDDAELGVRRVDLGDGQGILGAGGIEGVGGVVVLLLRRRAGAEQGACPVSVALRAVQVDLGQGDVLVSVVQRGRGLGLLGSEVGIVEDDQGGSHRHFVALDGQELRDASQGLGADVDVVPVYRGVVGADVVDRVDEPADAEHEAPAHEHDEDQGPDEDGALPGLLPRLPRLRAPRAPCGFSPGRAIVVRFPSVVVIVSLIATPLARLRRRP